MKGRVHISVFDATTEKSSVAAIKDRLSSSASNLMFSGGIKLHDSKRKRGRPMSAESLPGKQNIVLTVPMIPSIELKSSKCGRFKDEDIIQPEKLVKIAQTSSFSKSTECTYTHEDRNSRSNLLKKVDGNNHIKNDIFLPEYAHIS